MSKKSRRGQLSQITYSRRYYLVTSGKASWMPLYKQGLEQTIAAAGLPWCLKPAPTIPA
jgi:hypothetical protein